MEPIIEPIDREVLKNELSSNRFLRNTRKGGNEIYCVDIHNAPNVLKEIGRLREVTFRQSGGGTGMSMDLDEFDTSENCYKQLIVWAPEDQEITGGYRFILCKDAMADNDNIALSTSHYFNFSNELIENYLPNTVELGRSWIQPNYQPSVNPRKGLFALDNLWDGLGAITKTHSEIEYFFGKVTMYPDYNTETRNFLLHFMHHYFPDNNELAKPIYPLMESYHFEQYAQLLSNLEFKDGLKVLSNFAKENGEHIPPLINLYMNLSPTMKTFGTAINTEFGNVEETGILLTLADIYEDKKERYMTY